MRATLILWTVELMRVLTVATDSMLSCLEDEGLETRIWKATVSSEPPELPLLELLVEADDPVIAALWLARPSLETMKPDGRMGMVDESSPLIATLRAGMSIGAYITMDPRESMQLSWSIRMLFSVGMKGCFTKRKEKKLSYICIKVDFFFSNLTNWYYSFLYV